MNEQLIQKLYQQIVSLLTEKRLKEALSQLESLLYNCENSTLRNRVEQTQTSYQYMLEYMSKGVNDPKQQPLYRQLLRETWEAADQARITLLDEVSNHYYHTMRKNRVNYPKGYDLSVLQKILEGFTNDMTACQLLPDHQKMDIALMRHEQTHQMMFLSTWGNSNWSKEEVCQAEQMLQSELLPINDLCLFVSAITLSLMECFDESKVNWMLDSLRHKNPQITQRSLVGLVLILHIYSTRFSLYPKLTARLSLLGDNPNFGKQLNRIFIQLIHSQETEKINKKMQEEIFPEMIKNITTMRNMKFGFEETDENDRNPDWEQAFEHSGFNEKMREITDLQQEGADIYMSTFAQLKNYPFFREPHNWFYPFDTQHSSVLQQAKILPEKIHAIFSIILRSDFFCNSDKYSFCFTIAEIPSAQRDAMIKQIAPLEQSEMMEEKGATSLEQKAEYLEAISNQYIHDLYRFFKLSQRRSEFRNIFQEEIALHRIPALKAILGVPELLTATADFYFQKDHPAEALELYNLVIEQKVANAEIFQKAGYCLQKEKRCQEAINAYQKADVLKPDHIWTLRHLATCYRLIKSYSLALEYYKQAEAIQPENHTILFYTGSCLAELGQYEEALRYFFKLDFIEENCIKAWRGIGWCSFVSGKYEQAMKYYDKILAKKPITTDYLNAGHVAWRLGDIKKATTLYSKAATESGSKESFLDLFNKDRNSLIKQGISEEDIPLMLDMIQISHL